MKVKYIPNRRLLIQVTGYCYTEVRENYKYDDACCSTDIWLKPGPVLSNYYRVMAFFTNIHASLHSSLRKKSKPLCYYNRSSTCYAEILDLQYPTLWTERSSIRSLRRYFQLSEMSVRPRSLDYNQKSSSHVHTDTVAISLDCNSTAQPLHKY